MSVLENDQGRIVCRESFDSSDDRFQRLVASLLGLGSGVLSCPSAGRDSIEAKRRASRADVGNCASNEESLSILAFAGSSCLIPADRSIWVMNG